MKVNSKLLDKKSNREESVQIRFVFYVIEKIEYFPITSIICTQFYSHKIGIRIKTRHVSNLKDQKILIMLLLC